MRSSVKLLVLSALVGIVAASASFAALPIAGNSTGVFVNPVPDGSSPDLLGVGTNFFQWGTPFTGTINPPQVSGRSSVLFTGMPFNTMTDTDFVFGDLDYFNGTIFLGTGVTAFDLQVTLAFTTPNGITQPFTYNIGTITTPDSPNAVPDILDLPNGTATEFFSVGGVDYTLQILGFDDPDVAGFNPVSQFAVQEGSTDKAQLVGKVTVRQKPIPEASSLLLALPGLMGIGAYIRRRK